MKSFNKSTLFIVTALLAASVFSSCSKDNNVNDGEPRIKYIRVTNPVSADSLLVNSQFNAASARLRHCRNKRYAQNGTEKDLAKRLRRVSGARLFANC